MRNKHLSLALLFCLFLSSSCAFEEKSDRESMFTANFPESFTTTIASKDYYQDEFRSRNEEVVDTTTYSYSTQTVINPDGSTIVNFLDRPKGGKEKEGEKDARRRSLESMPDQAKVDLYGVTVTKGGSQYKHELPTDLFESNKRYIEYRKKLAIDEIEARGKAKDKDPKFMSKQEKIQKFRSEGCTVYEEEGGLLSLHYTADPALEFTGVSDPMEFIMIYNLYTDEAERTEMYKNGEKLSEMIYTKDNKGKKQIISREYKKGKLMSEYKSTL